ncbi:MAG: Ig-like domain-containing protein [Flavobacteriaceae bacterium]|nr:Ig-like domain-containing protein [Flavobacteriaceae bacterium]
MEKLYTNIKNKTLTLLLIFIATIQLNAQQVSYSFANLQNTNDGTNDYYEVDVMVSTDTDFKLGSGQLYINYNTLAFGDNIVANSNIEYTQPIGYILGEVYGFPAYKDFVKNDNTTSRVSLSFQQGVSSGTITSNNVTGTPKKLFHIKMKYLDKTKNPSISFETGSLFIGQTFTACGPIIFGFPDCTNFPGTQLTSDSFDNYMAGFTIVETAASTNTDESGTTDTFTVVLDAKPSSNVVISVVSGDTGESIVDKSTLTFTTSNWNVAQTVTVTGVSDGIIDGTQTINITIAVVDDSSDDHFDTLSDQIVSVDNTDTTKAITIAADAKTKIYGQSDPPLTYQITTGNLETGDNITGSLTRATGEDVNSYAISQGTLTAGSNYNITYVSANLAITTKAITITADAKSKVYGDPDPTLTYQMTSGTLETGDNITGSLTRSTGESVGNYAISSTLTNTNYNITYVSANLTITSAAVVATTQAASNITITEAVLNGTLNDGGATTTTSFEYGLASDLTGATTVSGSPATITAESGAKAVSLSLTNLTENTLYYYRIKGTNNQGTVNGNIMNFNTLDVTPPEIIGTVPADDDTGVTSSNLQIIFNEDIQKGTGDILIKRSSDDIVVATIPVNGSDVTIDNTSSKAVELNGTVTIYISPSLTLPSNTDLYVEIPNTAFEDLSGNAFPGFSANTSWNFSTDEVLGIDTNTIKGLSLYPNPVTNILSISASANIEQVVIYSLLGKKLKTIKSDFNKINTKELAVGLYFVKIYSEKGIAIRKLIKD